MKKKAFTLIELLAVIAVIAILFIVILSKVNFATDRAKDSGVLTDFRSYQIGIQQVIRENNIDSSITVAELNSKLTKNLDKKMQFVLNGTEYQSIAVNPYGYHYVLDIEGTEIKVYSINNQGDESILEANMNVYAANEYSVGKVMKLALEDKSAKPIIENFGDSVSVDEQIKSETDTETPVELAIPVAVITMTPSTGLDVDTDITWSYNNSVAMEEGATIVSAEWDNADAQYTVGEHVVKLRVKDSNNMWSEWTQTTIVVSAANRPPVPSISYSPSSNIYINTPMTWTPSATDPDGDEVVEYVWEGNVASFTNPGVYTVKLKARDARGLWSDWVTTTVTVTSEISFNSTTVSGFGGTSGAYDIAYGNGKYIVVGATGKMYTSTDLVNWTPVTSQFGMNLINAIYYGNGRFVAVGVSGKISYSTDGTTWTSAGMTSFVSAQISDVIYAGGRFVAVGDNGNYAFGTNGSTWSGGSVPSPAPQLRGIGYGTVGGYGTYVAVGGGGCVFTSTNDASTWIKRNIPVSETIQKVTYGNGIFVIAGQTKLLTSTDGVTWTVRDSKFGTSAITGVAYGNGMFAAVGDGGRISTSVDGINWTLRDTGSGLYNLNDVAFVNGKMIALGGAGRLIEIIKN